MKGYNFQFTMERKFENSEMEVFIQVENFIPERPAPACSNPDSPAFSDSGDPAEFDNFLIHFIIREKGKVFFVKVPDELLALIHSEVIDEIFSKGEKHHQKEMEEMYIND